MKTVNLTEEEHAELLKLRAAKTTKASATSHQDVVRAAGTSEGAKKGWEQRGVHVAEGQLRWTSKFGSPMSEPIEQANQKASEVDKEYSRLKSKPKEEVHREFQAGERLDMSHAKSEPKENLISHIMEGRFHPRHIEHWASGSWKSKDSSKASDATNTEVIHCRAHASAAGSVLAADAAWSPGESVEFMWMPAGRHTICAGFRNGSIELTVNCDENTAANVQASLDQWRTERPKQEPFGCIEHREHEASVRVSAQQAFSFKSDGVYIAAEPTMLGAQNVNGKVHRSWSPSFTTDADYSQAKTVKTASGATVMVFPEGVRGSRSNPADITGVDFCVGTLTNKPAFHAMSPVKSREAVMAANPEGKNQYSIGDHVVYNERKHRVLDVIGNQAMIYPHESVLTPKDKERGPLTVSFKKLVKASETNTTPSATITAHCAELLLRDVPDATAAEIACYDKCIDEGGSHITAVTEIKSQRKPEHVTQPAKASLEEIYDKVTAGEEAVKAMWSDAARKAALEARRHSAVALDEPLKRSMDGKPRADLDAYDETKKAHAASKKTATETGKGGYDQDSHNYAQSIHLRAAKAHEKAGDSHMAALHEKAADAHKAASIQIHKETWANKASDELTHDSIYAALEQRTAAANAVATEAGVISVEDVYAKVTASGASEAVKAASGAFAAGHPFYGNKYSKLTQRASFQAYAHGDSSHHAKAADAHHAAMSDHIKESVKYSAGSEERHAHLEAASHHLKESSRHAELSSKAEGSAKASDSTSSDPIHATWSDAARKAAAEARKKHSGETLASKLSSIAHSASGNAKTRGDHNLASSLHDQAAEAHDDIGSSDAEEHRELSEHHAAMAEESKAKASESKLTLQSIYARAGETR